MKTQENIATQKIIAALGPEYSYSHNLTQQIYNKAKYILCNTIENIFKEVSKNPKIIGIVPIENMINGTVRETFFALKNYKVKINKAYNYKIENCIASQTQDKFTKIITHPQPIGQCSEFLKQYRDKGIEIITTSSTSKAFQIAKENKDYAGIGSTIGAEQNKLTILHKNIGNNKYNQTRFIEISQQDIQSKNNTKTSMMIEPQEDRAGLLFEILALFKIKNFNLTKIESIPTGNKLDTYIFYIEVDGNIENKDFKQTLDFLKTIAKVYIFGSYKVVDIQ